MRGDSVQKGTTVITKFWDFDDDSDISDFTGTAVGGGTAVAVDGRGGILRISGAAGTDNSGYNLQHEGYPVTIGARRWAQAWGRFLPSDDIVEIALGFADAANGVITTPPTNGVYLHKAEDTNTWLVEARTPAGNATVNLGPIAPAADGWVTMGIRLEGEAEGQGRVVVLKGQGQEDKQFVDTIYDSRWGFQDRLFALPLSTVPLATTFAVQSGSTAGTQSVDLDYLAYRSSR